ncbi:MAG: ribbon-helix-helix protein, CopG family [Chloroflexi bacterium]|nr:ribbon-helix-helix protein, CopG family [Chloroflexota bacterium]
MSRTISARLSQTQTETLDGLARRKGVSRSQVIGVYG